MQRRTVLFLSLGLGLAAAALVVLRRDDTGPPVERPVERPVEPPVESQPSGVPAPVPPQPTTNGTQPPVAAPANGLRVHVAVTSRERFVPPPEPRTHARRAVDLAPLPTRLLAGAGAGFDAPPNAAGAALAIVDYDGTRHLRQVAVGPGAEPVLLGARLVVRGKVADAAGKQVPGTVVWFGEYAADGSPVEHTLGEEGTYEANVVAGHGVPFVVTAPGCAAQWRPITVAAPPGPCDATLAPAGGLDVQLVGKAVAMEQARLFVVPRGAVATALGQWPFFRQALTDGYAFDANGRTQVDDLPAVGEVALVVQHPHAPQGTAASAVLKAERVRANVTVTFTPGEWRGRVVDDAGAARVGVLVWSVSGATAITRGNAQRLVPPHVDVPGACAGRTDENGVFVLGASAGPSALLMLRADGCAGRDLAWHVGVAERPLVLPAWLGGEPELRVVAPRAGAPWLATSDLGGGVRELVAADATWRISLPHAGRFDVLLTTYVGDEERGREHVVDAMVTGPLPLQAPRAP